MASVDSISHDKAVRVLAGSLHTECGWSLPRLWQQTRPNRCDRPGADFDLPLLSITEEYDKLPLFRLRL